MKTLNEELENVKEDDTIIGANPPKIRTMFDVVKTGNYTLDEFKKSKELVAPEFESDINVRVREGISRGLQDIKNVPQGVEIFGGQVEMKIGGWAGSEETVERGRNLIKTAIDELDAKEKKYYQSAIPMSSKDYESLSFGVGQGITNYGAMLATGYLGGAVAGIGSMAVLEGSQKAQEKVGYYTEKTGDLDLKGYTPEQAGKDVALTSIYTVGSAILEKKLGYGAQRKLFKMPIGEKVKNVALTALSEGGTETLQELYATGIDLYGGYIDSSKLPERFLGAVQEGVIGGILGGTAGIAAAVNHRSQAKQILRENLQNTVPAKDLDNVVDAVYESTSDSMQNIITQELAQSEQLRNKHGAVYDSIKNEIEKQIKDTGAYSGVDEIKLSQYVEGTAKMFADQVLGEANKRQVLIDDVIKSSEIVYQDGKLYLQGVSQQTRLKRLKEKKIKEAKQPSLLQFIRLNGGIMDEGGELKNMDAAKQFIGLVNKKGSDIDTMGESLWQAGYFMERPTPAEVLEYIDDELRGVKHYPLGYVEQKGISQAENESRLDSEISEYADIMGYNLDKMGYDEKQEIYEQMQKNLYGEELGMEQPETVDDFAFADNEFFQVADEKKDLYATHNMSLAGVREALKLGGLAMPSLAMRKISQGNINQFGDVVFVANEKLATPSRTNEVYDRDAWTPSLFYNVRYDLLPEANTFIKNVLEKAGQPLRASVFRYNIAENIDSPNSNTMAMELYALDKGKEENYNIGNDPDYLDWYDEHFTANTEPYLWTENASNTDMVRKKFTLENMMKILRKKEKSGGGFIGDYIFDIYKLLNFRSQKFKNLKEIKKNRHKLVSREEQREKLDKLNEDFLALAEGLKKDGEEYGFGQATHGLGLALIQDSDERIEYWLKSENLKSDESAVKKVKDFIERMKDIPTDYFEVKPRRIVNFDEFSGVIIPEGKQYDEIAKKLQEQYYLTVERVEKGNEEQYEQALQNIQENASTTFFQLSKQEEENFTDMYVSEGKKGVLDWINGQIEYYRNNVDNAVNENAKAYLRKIRDERIAWLREVEDFINKLDSGEITKEQKVRTTDKELEKKAKKHFGTTYNINEAGYILTDGSMLDFSGKREGGRAGNRAYDHRDISQAFEETGFDVNMEDFVNNGAIRYMPETNSFYIANLPTSQQLKVISNIVDKTNGEVNIELVDDAKNMGMAGSGFYKEFESGSTIKNIKNAINAYYSGNLSKLQEFYQIKNLPKQKGKIKGAFDALTKSIEITSEADFSTYQHEFAHYWLDNIWNYAQSGKASERYMKQFNEIKKWLGVKPEQTYLTRQQHEKFARGYEKWLFKGTYPTPIIGDVFKEYEDFIKEVYDSIAEIDTRAGAKYKPVPKVVYDFFNSMVTGTLPYTGEVESPKETVEKETKEVKEYVKEEQKELAENTENYLLKPVQTDTKTGYLTAYKKMTGEEVEGGSVTLENEMEKAEKFVNENPDLAKQIVDGVAPVPDGMLKNTIYIAYDNLQKKLGNTKNRANSLMNQALELRRMGQEISSQRLAYRDGASPLSWIQAVQESKASALADSNRMQVRELNDLIDKSIKYGMKQGKTAKEIAKDLREQLGVTEFYQEEVYKTYETDESSYNYIYKYVNQQLGLSLTEEQAETITRKADDMLSDLENSKAENGNPSVEYFVKEKDLENYANSIAPSSQARIIVSVVGRGNLLFSIKSPLTNVISNTFVGAFRAATRRIMLGQYTNIVDPELIKQNKQYSWEIFRKTGYNVNNMTPETPRNTILGEKLTHSEGAGNIRKLGRFYENLIYKWSLGAGDVIFKDYAFTDYVALKATKESNGDTKTANEIFKDACLIEPQTDLGKEIRAEAIQESLIATYQNKGLISEKALKARESLDFGVGFGEFIAPFVKTPANVVGMGLKAGFGSVKAIASEIQRDLRAGKIQPMTKENIDLVVQNGLGLLLAAMMLSFIDDDEYMPPYAIATNKDKQLAKELNISYNSIRIGNTWISLDYLGPLASPLVGLLQARREDGVINKIFGYSKSGAIQSLSIPAFGNIADIFTNVENMVRKEGADVAAETLNDTIQAVYARTIPSIVSDVAKMLDKYDRETKGHEIRAKIPLARHKLPKKVNVTSGRAESLDSPINELLFGARAKTQVVNPVAKELQRLNNKGYGVSLTPVTQRGLLSGVDEKTKEKVRNDFAKEYSSQVKKLIYSPSYKRMHDEDKKNAIDKIRRKTVESLKKRYLKK